MNDAKQATPAAELERQICSATEPKNEREWWAHREIARLRAALAEADEPVAWRTEAARWLRRRADVEEWASEKTGWANPARQMPATLRRIADDLEAEQEESPYGMDCSPEPRREPLTEEQIRDLWSWASTHEAEKTATTQQHAFARAIERAHGIGGGE